MYLTTHLYLQQRLIKRLPAQFQVSISTCAQNKCLCAQASFYSIYMYTYLKQTHTETHTHTHAHTHTHTHTHPHPHPHPHPHTHTHTHTHPRARARSHEFVCVCARVLRASGTCKMKLGVQKTSKAQYEGIPEIPYCRIVMFMCFFWP